MNINVDERIAKLLRSARYDAGKSQEYVAKALGVSKKTVQNWESAYSSPNISTIMQWFSILGIPIYPYLFKISHPEFDTLNANSSDDDIRRAFVLAVNDMDVKSVRKGFFEMFGGHGTAPDGMGDVKTAYLHLPMDIKVGIAEIIATQFEICQAQGRLVKPDHIMPDITKLRSYIESAKKAVIEGRDTYL